MAALADGPVPSTVTRTPASARWAAILDALRALGARVDGDAAAVHRARPGVTGGEVTLDASASSQFVSGLLLTAARFAKGVTIRHVGPPVPSQPHIRMTIHMLRTAGVAVDDTEPDVWRVEPGPIAARDWAVEPDLSNAAPFLAAALVTGGTVTVPDWPLETTQAGDALRGLLTEWAPRSAGPTGRPTSWSAAPARSPGSTPTCTRSAS